MKLMVDIVKIKSNYVVCDYDDIGRITVMLEKTFKNKNKKIISNQYKKIFDFINNDNSDLTIIDFPTGDSIYFRKDKATFFNLLPDEIDELLIKNDK